MVPTFENYVTYEKLVPTEDDGIMRILRLEGIINKSENSIYEWEKYNMFESDPTAIPDGYILKIRKCDECGDNLCDRCVNRRKSWLERCRFGSKIRAEDYVPVIIVHTNTDMYYIHDNMSRPFKVYVDKRNKKFYVYKINPNVIFDYNCDCGFYCKYDTVITTEVMSVSHVSVNDQLIDNDNDNEEEDEKECACGRENEYYDYLVYESFYEKIFIPDGYYTTMDKNRNWVTKNNDRYIGNTILVYLGSPDTSAEKDNIHKYLTIESAINELFLDEKIDEYCSLVGNNDVPYPVAVSRNYMYFMCDLCREPLEKYKNVPKNKYYNAYHYFYGNTCTVCNKDRHKNKCKCIREKFKSERLNRNTIHKRIM